MTTHVDPGRYAGPYKPQTDATKIFARHWAKALSGNEFKMVCIIADESVYWNREETRDPMSYGKLAHRTGLTKKTVIGVVAALKERGILSCRAEGDSFTYSLNLNWEPEDVVFRERKTPKTPCGAGVNSTLRTPKAGIKTTPPLIWKENLNPVKEKQSGPAGPALSQVRGGIEGLRQNLNRVESRARERRDAKAKKGDLWAIWAKAHREAFPDAAVPRWSPAEYRLAKTFVTTEFGQNVNGVEVLEFSVLNWRRVVNAKIVSWWDNSKHGQPPELPNIKFMASKNLRKYFFEAHHEGFEALGERLQADERGKRIYRMMKKHGYTKEEAERVLASGEEHAALKKQLAEAHAEKSKTHARNEAIQREALEIIRNQRHEEGKLRRAKEAAEKREPLKAEDVVAPEGFGHIPQNQDW